MKYAEITAKNNNYKRCSLIAKDEVVARFYKKINYTMICNKNILGDKIIKMIKYV